MEDQDLLALRFPSRVPVRFQVLEKGGTRVPGGPWPAQGVDVSRTGVRLEATALPSALIKRLGDYEAELRIEVGFDDVPGIDLPVVGLCRWLKDFGEGRWILGIEYLSVDRGRGVAIANHFERKYLRPKVVRMGATFTGLFVLFAAALVYGAWERQRAAVARAEAELQAAIESKESLAILIAALESRLPAPGTAPSPELAKEIASLRKELDDARNEVGRRSARLVERSARTNAESPAQRKVELGNRFFSDGNLSAALIEYRQANEIEPKLPEPYLKMGIVHEFQDRPLEALESYGRYLELRRDAPDWFEVNTRVERLYEQEAAKMSAVSATPATKPAATPAPAAPAGASVDALAKRLLEEGRLQIQSEHVDDAVKTFQKVVKDFNGYPDGHYWLATALAMQGEDAKACRSFRRYLELSPDGTQAATARVNVANCD